MIPDCLPTISANEQILSNFICRKRQPQQLEIENHRYSLDGLKEQSNECKVDWLIEIDVKGEPIELGFSNQSLQYLLFPWINLNSPKDLPLALVEAALDILLEAVADNLKASGSIKLERLISKIHTLKVETSSFDFLVEMTCDDKKLEFIVINASNSVLKLLDNAIPLTNHSLSLYLSTFFEVSRKKMLLPDLRCLERGDVILLSDAASELSQLNVLLAQQYIGVSVLNDSQYVFKPRRKLVNSKSDINENLEENTEITSEHLPNTDSKELNLQDVEMDISFRIAGNKEALSELSSWGDGMIISLPELAEEKIEIFANQQKIGQGELVQVNNKLGVKVVRWSGDGR
ncbi:FliM/FliN family flagellar motor switch protein [Pleionea sediminis]|uniref:FliM/FliN family flagellar motor switch protein n=1 Tax=Pleionea sediminis TaxID=2569479 RepID=UPI001184812E|nr:FliM/FliN family flagellar motor switch protein [Pleionea sediminis]